jgi:hypothetical protein
MSGWAVGTRLWFVPIRFWETTEPQTGHVAEHVVVGNVRPDDSSDNHVYAYHDGYGHNVYMERADSFETPEAAVAEAERRAAEKAAKDKAEFDEWWSRVIAAHPPKAAS